MSKVALVVDDDPHIRDGVREVLEGSGYAVKEAADADEALILLEEDGIAVVLLAVEMPGHFSGFDLARLIRVLWPSLALIATEENQRSADDELPPHTAVLTKPFSRERLIEAVRGSA